MIILCNCVSLYTLNRLTRADGRVTMIHGAALHRFTYKFFCKCLYSFSISISILVIQKDLFYCSTTCSLLVIPELLEINLENNSWNPNM